MAPEGSGKSLCAEVTRRLTFDNNYRLIEFVMQFDAGKFRLLCGEHGLAVTHQRQVIYQALMRMNDHPSPEAVYEKVRKQIPSISLATVYKNIKTFVDSGMLREVSLHHGSTRLEKNLTPHHHLVCIRCKRLRI